MCGPGCAIGERPWTRVHNGRVSVRAVSPAVPAATLLLCAASGASARTVWGLHPVDANIALGTLIKDVTRQAKRYLG